MPKTRKTRPPSVPAALKSSYEERRRVTREAAIAVLMQLKAAGLDVNKRNWDDAKSELNASCDWRTTYGQHLKDLFASVRGQVRQVHSGTPGSIAVLERRLDKAQACIHERDEEIRVLRERIQQLEWDNMRMSRGTRERRRRKAVQGRQMGSGEVGSVANAT